MTDIPDPILTVFKQLFREATTSEVRHDSDNMRLLWAVPVPTFFNSITETTTGVLTKGILAEAFKQIEDEPPRSDIYPDSPIMRAILSGVPSPLATFFSTAPSSKKETRKVTDEAQTIDTILDKTVTTYKVEYRHTAISESHPHKVAWVVEYANIFDYPEAHQKAEVLATMYAHVRVVRIEKNEKLTVAWASNRTS